MSANYGIVIEDMTVDTCDVGITVSATDIPVHINRLVAVSPYVTGVNVTGAINEAVYIDHANIRMQDTMSGSACIRIDNRYVGTFAPPFQGDVTSVHVSKCKLYKSSLGVTRGVVVQDYTGNAFMVDITVKDCAVIGSFDTGIAFWPDGSNYVGNAIDGNFVFISGVPIQTTENADTELGHNRVIEGLL